MYIFLHKKILHPNILEIILGNQCQIGLINEMFLKDSTAKCCLG